MAAILNALLNPSKSDNLNGHVIRVLPPLNYELPLQLQDYILCGLKSILVIT